MPRIIVLSPRHREAALKALEETRDAIRRRRFIKSPTFRGACDAADKAFEEAIEMMVNGTSEQRKLRRRARRLRREQQRRTDPVLRRLVRRPSVLGSLIRRRS